MRRLQYALLLLGVVACSPSEPLTQSILHVRTNFTLEQVDAVRVRMLRDDVVRAEAVLKRPDARADIGTLGLAPDGPEGVEQPYEVEVTALLGDDEVYTVRHTSDGFAPERTRQHYACLAQHCLAAPACPANEVCSVSGCQPARWPNHDAPGLDWQACTEAGEAKIPVDAEHPRGGNSGFEVWRAGGAGDQVISDIEITADGTGIIVGHFSNGIDLGATSMLGEGIDGFVAAVSPAGELQWFLQFGGTGDQRIVDVGADSRGELWVVGDFTEGVEIRRDGTEVGRATSLGGKDAFLIPVTSDGSVGALRILGGPGEQSARAVSAHGAIVAVVGVFDSPPMLAPTCAALPIEGRSEVVTDEDGFVWVSTADVACGWVLHVGGPGPQTLETVSVSQSEIVVGGSYAGEGFVVPRRRASASVPAAQGVDALLLHLNWSGDVQRVMTVGGAGPDRILIVRGTRAYRDDPFIVGGMFGAGDRLLWTAGATRTLPVQGHLIAFALPPGAEAPLWTAASRQSDVAPAVHAAAWLEGGRAALGIDLEGVSIWQDGLRTESQDAASDALVAFVESDGAVRTAVQFGGSGPDAVRALSQTQSGLVVGGSYQQTLELAGRAWPLADGSDAWIHWLPPE